MWRRWHQQVCCLLYRQPSDSTPALPALQGVNKFRFGEGLELPEQQWLVYEINSHLEQQRGKAIDYEAMPQPEVPKSYYNDNNTRDLSPP